MRRLIRRSTTGGWLRCAAVLGRLGPVRSLRSMRGLRLPGRSWRATLRKRLSTARPIRCRRRSRLRSRRAVLPSRLARRRLGRGSRRLGLRRLRRCRRWSRRCTSEGSTAASLRWHHGHLRHGLWSQLHHTRFDLGVDAPQERPGVEIEERAIGIDHASRLRPGRQGIDRALLKRLNHLDRGGNPGREVCFGQVAGSPEVPKQLGHFRIIAG